MWFFVAGSYTTHFPILSRAGAGSRKSPEASDKDEIGRVRTHIARELIGPSVPLLLKFDVFSNGLSGHF